jgi:hypothetical protein
MNSLIKFINEMPIERFKYIMKQINIFSIGTIIFMFWWTWMMQSQ